MWLALAIGTSWVGCILLAMSQTRYWRATKTTQTPPRWLRPAGFLFLLFALYARVQLDGSSFAALLWPLVLALTAFLTTMLLTYKSAWLHRLALLVI